ncbi:vanin-like protein 2 [Drosophila montana]|uniref:vanin-like protein 2 n=1 Tax=Drosophila montana TaxID=40370 RepID=UPI00313E319F
MYIHVLQLIILATFLAGTSQLSLPTDNTYHAGVVEYPDETGTPRERTTKATEGFVAILESNATADLDILVFPESVLSNLEMATFVPHPAQNITPCYSPDYELFLVELSCATRSRGIYVVINVVEKELCGDNYGSDTLNPCPSAGFRYFNTNIVLDRSGRVVSRYRKSHLWRREYNTRATMRQPELAIFETDFGVTFGHFICFDMLFYEPAMQLLLERNVTDIIYPTYWFSELPFLGAVQLQEGWAYANNVNLLAADASQPSGRTSGSGIYAGRAGRLAAVIHEQPTLQLLKAHVPKRTPTTVGSGSGDGGRIPELPAQVVPAFEPQLVTPRYTELATYRDYNVDIFSTRLLEAEFQNVTQRLCHGDFCCSFQLQRRPTSISVSSTTTSYASYRYRLGVYLGNRTALILVDRSELAVCALFACLDEQLSSCGRIYPKHIDVANRFYFERIRIEGNFPAAARRLIMPSTLDGSMMPLSVAQFNWTESPPAKQLLATQIQLELLLPKNDLLTFGIWANYFTQLPSTHNLNHLQPAAMPAPAASAPNASAGVPGVAGGAGGAGGAASAAVSILCLLPLLPLLLQL